jgi:hypothetical protein
VPILKYDANQDALVKWKEETQTEEEEKPKTSQLTFEEGEDTESKDDESCMSCSQLIVESWHRKEGGSPSYVHDCMHTYK